MQTDVIIDDPRWSDLGLASLAETAAGATLDHLGLTPPEREVAVLGCNDTRIADLNRDFRGKSVPTNVLSWPSEELAAPEDGAPPTPPSTPELGDIAIAFDTCQSEAVAQGKTLSDHTLHLLVHATLHLLGYDHIRPKDAQRMEALEVEILARLGVADPY